MTEETARTGHYQRVGAYTNEILRALNADSSDLNELLQAEQIETVLDPRLRRLGLSGLIRELGITINDSHPDIGDPSVELAKIIEIADLLDNEIEMSAYEGLSLSERLTEIEDSPVLATVLPWLRRCIKEDLVTLIPKLPVFPATALDILSTIRQDDVSVSRLIHIASRDQAIAGGLLQLANSATSVTRRQITNVGHAVIYLGIEKAGSAMLALSLRPLLVRPGMADLWRHSLDAASVAEKLAEACGLAPCEGYLLGLVHDVGRLLLELAPREALQMRNRLLSGGCELSIAEVIACGMDHTDAGALVLQRWGMPEEYVNAVRDHHQPERTDSKLAAMLYLVEFWSATEEDLPSTVRLQTSLHRLGIPFSEIMNMKIRRPSLA